MRNFLSAPNAFKDEVSELWVLFYIGELLLFEGNTWVYLVQSLVGNEHI